MPSTLKSVLFGSFLEIVFSATRIVRFAVCVFLISFCFNATAQTNQYDHDIQGSVSMDFNSRIRGYDPEKILAPSPGISASYFRQWKNEFLIGVTGFYSINSFDESFDFNEIMTIEELKYKMKPYHDPYYLGIGMLKVFELNRNYSLSVGLNGGFTMNNYGKLKLPVNPNYNLDYSSIDLRPMRSFKNTGFFVMPAFEVRKNIQPFYFLLKFGYLMRETSTTMRLQYLDEEKQVLNEERYQNFIRYSSFNIQIGLGRQF